MIDPTHPRLSLVRQCALVAVSRSSFYYAGTGETALNLELMRLIDAQCLETPYYGSRQMTRHLRRQGYGLSRKRIRRWMRTMGLTPIYQTPRTSAPHPGHRIYPYLLRDVSIDRPDHVWCADIIYIPMRRGFLYLVAIMDWASRRGADLDGRPGPLDGQHLHRAALAHPQVRMHLSARVRNGLRHPAGPQPLGQPLQPRPTALVARGPHPRRGVSRHRPTHRDGASPRCPNPQHGGMTIQSGD